MHNLITIKIRHATTASPTKLVVCYMDTPIASFADPAVATDYADSIDIAYAKWMAGWNTGHRPNYSGVPND